MHQMQIVEVGFDGAPLIAGTEEHPSAQILFRISGSFGLGEAGQSGRGVQLDVDAGLGLRIFNALEFWVEQNISTLTAGVANSSTGGRIRWHLSRAVSLEAYIQNYVPFWRNLEGARIPNETTVEVGAGIQVQY